MSVRHWRDWLRLWLTALAAVFLLASAGSGAAHATTSDAVQWQSDITVSFTAEQLAQPDWAATAQALQNGLAARLQARRVQLAAQQVARADRGLDFKFSMAGQGSLAQFKQVMFDDAQPLGGLIGGPALLKLTGDVAAGQELALTLESNPTTGYLWRVEGLDRTLLGFDGAPSLQVKASGLGVPMRQTIRLRGLGQGRATLTLRYARSFENEQPDRTIALQAARLDELTDLTDPAAVQIEQPTEGHAPLLAEGVTPQSLPAAFDWRSQSKVTPVRNQKSCGSCWAFSTVGAFESDLLIQNNISTDLSEQYLVSCNTNGWSCSGGWFAHDYHINELGKNQTAAGAVLESAFPYSATNGSCTKAYDHVYKLGSWHYVTNGSSTPSVDALKSAIYNYGPVSATVCVGTAFNGYSGGVFKTEEKSQCNGGVNHGIVLVGWNDADGAWIMKNSWGQYWGESGYMRIAYGISNIGYAANYVVGNGTPPPTACYSLATNVSPSAGGSVSASPGPNCNNGTQYTQGTQVTLTPRPAAGYYFKKWSGDVTGAANPLVLTIGGSKTVTANFAVKNRVLDPSFELDANADGRPDNWTSTPKFTRSSITRQDGTYAGRLSASDNRNITIKQTAKGFVENTAYNFSGWVNIPATNDAFTFTVKLQWRRADGTLIRTDVVNTLTGATSGWIPVSTSLTSPPGSALANIVLAAANLDATIYVDNFYLGP